MNYTIITNHAHAHTNSLQGHQNQKKSFIAPILKFPSAKISKTINVLCTHGTTINIFTTSPRPHFAHRDFQKKSVSKNKLATAPNRRNAPLKIQNVAATWRIFVRMWRIFVTCGMQPLSWLNIKFLRRLKDTTIISVCAADQ